MSVHRQGLMRFKNSFSPLSWKVKKLFLPFFCKIFISVFSIWTAKISGKENSLVLFWRKITETLLSSNGGFYTFAKLMLLRLLVLVVRDSVITLSAIAYNVNNNLDEVLLAIVCTVYSGNIITRSRLFLKVAVTRAFVTLGSSALVQRQAGSHAEGSWRSVSPTPTSLVEDCCFQ